jgi:hypothetical protein
MCFVINRNDFHCEIRRRMNSLIQLANCFPKTLKIRVQKIIILPFLLYGCESWSLTLREGHKLQVYESKVLRKLFGPKKTDISEQFRILHNDDEGAGIAQWYRAGLRTG